MFLIDTLLTLPVRGFLGIFTRIQEMAEQELSDEPYLLEKLMALRLRFELDEISEEVYSQQERELLARLDAARGVDE